jgi:hypothetical protein
MRLHARPLQRHICVAAVCVALTAGFTFANPVAGAAGPPVIVSTDPTYGDVGSTTYTGFAGALNPDGLDTTFLFQYGRSLSYGGRSPSPPRDVGSGTSTIPVYSQSITGLVPGSLYHYRLVAVNLAGTVYSDDKTFTTCAVAGCEPPAVTGEPATGVGQSGATLNAEVNPNGGSYSTCYFSYSTDSTVTSELHTTPGVNIGHGDSSMAVAADVTGLTPDTTYYAIAACQNDVDQNEGAVIAFTTRASTVITTGIATQVTDVSATLAGGVTSAPAGSTCRFDYGRTLRYGGHTASVSMSTGGSADFSGFPSRLAARALYHYRATCSAGGSGVVGADRTFTTLSG